MNNQAGQDMLKSLYRKILHLYRINRNALYPAILLFFIILLSVQSTYSENLTEIDSNYIIAEPALIKENPFSFFTVNAESAFVYDLTQRETLYEKNIDLVSPLASLTKIMSAIVAQEKLAPDEKIYITKNSIAKEGDEGLLVGDYWNAEDLLAFAIVSSSNDAIHAVRSHLKSKNSELVSLMNEKARIIGAKSVYFTNETGLDISTELSGAYGSAKDYMKILEYASSHHENLFKKTAQSNLTLSSAAGFKYNIENTNTAIDVTPQLIISKTGYTDLAGGNLAIIFEKEPGHRIGVVVLGSTREERFNDVKKLLWAAVEYNK